jgi:hypothetical protein
MFHKAKVAALYKRCPPLFCKQTKELAGFLPFEVVLKRHRKQIFDCPEISP